MQPLTRSFQFSRYLARSPLGMFFSYHHWASARSTAMASIRSLD
ncbi:hypothetical protein ACFWBN_22100 [Streptomyces sp. NPDC059989]